MTRHSAGDAGHRELPTPPRDLAQVPAHREWYGVGRQSTPGPDVERTVTVAFGDVPEPELTVVPFRPVLAGLAEAAQRQVDLERSTLDPDVRSLLAEADRAFDAAMTSVLLYGNPTATIDGHGVEISGFEVNPGPAWFEPIDLAENPHVDPAAFEEAFGSHPGPSIASIKAAADKSLRRAEERRRHERAFRLANGLLWAVGGLVLAVVLLVVFVLNPSPW